MVLLHLEEFFFVQFTVAINVHVFEESCCVCSRLRKYISVIKSMTSSRLEHCFLLLVINVFVLSEEETNLLIEGRSISALSAKHRVNRLHHTGHLLFVDRTALVRIVTRNFKNHGVWPHSRNKT